MVVKVGDRLFLVEPRQRSRGEPLTANITVTKVGRRWAEFQRDGYGLRLRPERFDIEDMRVDGGGFSHAGSVYPSEEHWREQTRRQVLWDEFRRRLDRAYSIPPGVTQIGILKAADALGIKLESE